MQTRTQSLVKCSLCAHSKDLTRALGQVPCEFYAKRPCLAYRVHIAVNAVVLALLPGLVLLALPLPQGYQEQGIFYKDTPFLLVVSLFMLGLSSLVVSLRYPLRYRVTASKVLPPFASPHMPDLAPPLPCLTCHARHACYILPHSKQASLVCVSTIVVSNVAYEVWALVVW